MYNFPLSESSLLGLYYATPRSAKVRGSLALLLFYRPGFFRKCGAKGTVSERVRDGWRYIERLSSGAASHLLLLLHVPPKVSTYAFIANERAN